MKSIIFFLLLFIHLINGEFVCQQNFSIKNSWRNFDVIKNCTRIEGFVHILNIDKESDHQLDGLSFPLLKEITDYLLIFNVQSLSTLEWFPNLMYIRGKNLFEGNALIINNLQNVSHLSFPSLKHLRGSVRIEDVPKLCFSQTTDYNVLVRAIRNNLKHSPENTHLLPGFVFFSKLISKDNMTEKVVLTAHWNYTHNLRNTSIDYFIMDLIEFEDLDIYKEMERNYSCSNNITDRGHNWHRFSNCQKFNDKPYDSLITDLTGLTTSSLDYLSSYIIFENVKISMVSLEKGPQQYFVFSAIDQIMETQLFKPKIYSVAYVSSQQTLTQNIDKSVGNEIKIDKTETFDPRIYQIYGVFKSRTKENRTSWHWNNSIKPFRYYYLIVRACSHHSSCFIVAHQRIRTQPLANADDIDDNSVKYESNEYSVTISWLEPEKPNGAIISYQIYFHESKNKTNEKIFCLNREEFRAMDQKYTINDLNRNTEYSFRIGVTSMNGPSNKFTKYFKFQTKLSDTLDTQSNQSIIYILVGLTVLMVSFLLIAMICYFKSPKRHNSQLDIISVNPEYEKFIVDPLWEVKRCDLKLFHVLGDGAFGRVYYGELFINTKVIKCAVKTLNTNHRTQQRDNFLKEANIMKSFIECHHIVKLIGIVSIENPVLVLMEYMVNGDLKTYLRFNRPDSDENPNPRVPTWNRIFQMAIEIADGMAYLSSHKFVHRDLAARNCMVAEDLTVKIGDFGMTRDVYDNDYYRKRDSGLIPVRWMSPEALRDGVFTTYSDIWAYGVVLWEMVTLGAQPYQGYSNESVFQSVIRGVRLTEPDNCPKKLWRLMHFCWRKNPRIRPSFNEITQYLLPTANQSFREVCYYLNRRPFLKKQQSFKNIIYSLIPSNRLLLNDKHLDECEEQYCQMEPQIQRKLNLSDKEYSFKEIEILNKKNNEMNAKNTDQMINCLTVNNDKQMDKTIEQKLIEC